MTVPSFDGPSDTRSRSGSQHSAGSHSRNPSHPGGSHVSASQAGRSNAGGSSRPPSNAGAPANPEGYPQPLGFDPGRDEKPETPEDVHRKTVGRRVDLPPEAFIDVGFSSFFLTFTYSLPVTDSY